MLEIDLGFCTCKPKYKIKAGSRVYICGKCGGTRIAKSGNLYKGLMGKIEHGYVIHTANIIHEKFKKQKHESKPKNKNRPLP